MSTMQVYMMKDVASSIANAVSILANVPVEAQQVEVDPAEDPGWHIISIYDNAEAVESGYTTATPANGGDDLFPQFRQVLNMSGHGKVSIEKGYRAYNKLNTRVGAFFVVRTPSSIVWK